MKTEAQSCGKVVVVRRRAGGIDARVETGTDGQVAVRHKLEKGVVKLSVSDRIRAAADRMTGAEIGKRLVDSTIKLRVDQVDVFADIVKYFNQAADHLMAYPDNPFQFGRFIQPPRTGKMVIIAETIARAGVTAVVLVPSQNLVLQAAHEIRSKLPTVPVGIYYGEDKDLVSGGVNIATYQIVQRHAQLGKLPAAIRQATVIFCDEAHRSMTEARQEMLRQAFEPSALRIACTATPDWNEERTLATHFPHLIHEITLQEAVTMDLFARLKVSVMSVSVDGSSLQTVGGDFDANLLGDLMAAAPFLEASRVLRYEIGDNAKKPALICCASVKQAKDVRDYLVSNRPPGTSMPALIIGDDPNKKGRQEALQAFEAGLIDTLINVGVLIEGWDSPRCKLEIDLAPTLSEVRARQKYFRVMTKYGSAEALIYVLLPVHLRHVPIFPQVLFGASVEFEGSHQWSNSKPVQGKLKEIAKSNGASPKLAAVELKSQLLHDFDSYERRLNPRSTDQIREIVMQTFDMSRGLPLRSAFMKKSIDHPLFKGMGAHLLRYCGVRNIKGSYLVFMTKLFPGHIADRILEPLGLGSAELPSCEVDVEHLCSTVPTVKNREAWRQAWRTLFGPDHEDINPVSVAILDQQLKRLVAGFNMVLTDRQRFVLTRRFGLDVGDEEDRSFSDVGDEMGLSGERVRGIERAAFTRFREQTNIEDPDERGLTGDSSSIIESLGLHRLDHRTEFRGQTVYIAVDDCWIFHVIWNERIWKFNTRPSVASDENGRLIAYYSKLGEVGNLFQRVLVG